MNFLFSRARRNNEVYRAILRDLPTQVFSFTVHDPTWIGRILGGDDVPAVWVTPTLDQLPDDPVLHRKVLAYTNQLARRFAHALLQSTSRRNQLNSTITAAQAEQNEAQQKREAAGSALSTNRPAVRSQAGHLEELNQQIRLLKTRAGEHLGRAGLWYAGAAILVGLETVTIASNFFQARPDADEVVKAGIWFFSGSLSAALAWVAERGLRPLLEPGGNASVHPLRQLPVRVALGALLLLTLALAGIRVEGMGEGGLTDFLQFVLMVVAAPFLALWSGLCGSRGRQQFQLAEGLKQEQVSLEQQRIHVNSSFAEAELDEEDQEAAFSEADARHQKAVDAELRAIREKEALLRELFEGVASHPDMLQIADALAREAADLRQAARLPGGGAVPLLLCCLLAPSLAGCNHDVRAALGGPQKVLAVEVLLDRTHSLAEREPFRAAVEAEHATFLGTAPFGSRLEVWSIGGVPGEPRALCSFSLLKVKPRDRKRVQAEERARLASALEALPAERLPWSSILEDGYRLGERVSALPADHRCVVVMSDLLQYTPRLTTSQVISARDQEALLQRTLGDYPPFPRPLDEVRLLYLPGRAGKKPLSPRDAQRVKEFWRELWTRWGAREVRLTEPELTVGSGEERTR